ncbi:EamA family transporter RarD [Streptomyces sp. TR06-5]|uniref:EamA family transporter RarD n=1 Tax=Streptomyces sp. TR06-5 TaxID=3385976 RepID=UPI0039A3CA3F
MSSSSDTRSGLVYGFAAYGLWGLLPLYWHLLAPTGAAEVLAHRMVWSLPTAVLVLAAMRRWSWIRDLVRRPRTLGIVALAAIVISANWGMFIWAVSEEKLLEASLGYFINPLVSIAFGIVLLRERLRPAQWVAVGIGAAAVAVLTVGYGEVPWLSIALAFTFATYGLLKKRVKLEGVESFSAEAAVQFLPALGFLVFLASRGDAGFTTDGPGNAVLLALSGAATAAPLIFFGSAAVRLPLSTIGLLQYTAPAFMFVLGLLVFHEPMPAERLTGFLLVWAALALLSWDAFRNARRGRRALREAARNAAAYEAGHSAGPTGTAAAHAERPAWAGGADRRD